MTTPSKKRKRRPSMEAISKAAAAMKETLKALVESRRLYRQWFREAERCYKMLVARNDPANRKDLAKIKATLDAIRPKRKKRLAR